MMTDKTKTPQKIFLQEDYGKQEYGIEQDYNVRGMVRYFRCDEDYNKIKRVLAIALMNYLDNNRPEGKMCLSNGECANIDDAFAIGDWDMVSRYIEKYIGEGTLFNPEVLPDNIKPGDKVKLIIVKED